MPTRLAAPLAVVALAIALLAGCGDSDSGSDTGSRGGTETPAAPVGAAARSCAAGGVGVAALRATGVSCAEALRVTREWRRSRSCTPAAGASRASCESRAYRCVGARTDRGVAVSCARPGRSLAFIAQP